MPGLLAFIMEVMPAQVISSALRMASSSQGCLMVRIRRMRALAFSTRRKG